LRHPSRPNDLPGRMPPHCCGYWDQKTVSSDPRSGTSVDARSGTRVEARSGEMTEARSGRMPEIDDPSRSCVTSPSNAGSTRSMGGGLRAHKVSERSRQHRRFRRIKINVTKALRIVYPSRSVRLLTPIVDAARPTRQIQPARWSPAARRRPAIASTRGSVPPEWSRPSKHINNQHN
jgi:hypothetical protein